MSSSGISFHTVSTAFLATVLNRHFLATGSGNASSASHDLKVCFYLSVGHSFIFLCGRTIQLAYCILVCSMVSSVFGGTSKWPHVLSESICFIYLFKEHPVGITYKNYLVFAGCGIILLAWIKLSHHEGSFWVWHHYLCKFFVSSSREILGSTSVSLQVYYFIIQRHFQFSI